MPNIEMFYGEDLFDKSVASKDGGLYFDIEKNGIFLDVGNNRVPMCPISKWDSVSFYTVDPANNIEEDTIVWCNSSQFSDSGYTPLKEFLMSSYNNNFIVENMNVEMLGQSSNNYYNIAFEPYRGRTSGMNTPSLADEPFNVNHCWKSITIVDFNYSYYYPIDSISDGTYTSVVKVTFWCYQAEEGSKQTFFGRSYKVNNNNWQTW